MANHEFFVRGTSCKSCEVVIERELKKQPGIHSVDVSHAKGRISFKTNGDRAYSHHELNELLNTHGYSVGLSDKRSKGVRRVNWQHVGAMLVLVASVYIILDQVGLLRFSPSSAAPASMLGVFVVGLVASVSSCTAVVGGLVAAVSSSIAKTQENMTQSQKMQPHILFNAGRIIGFVVLGTLIGYLGSAIQLSTTLNGLFVLVVAALMIVIGINLLDVFPTPVVSMPKWLAHRVHDLAESNDPKAPFALGAMTFFLPCGFTQSMQLYALTLQDPIQAGMVMGVFALGTAPALIGIGSATTLASGNTLKKITQLAGVLVVVLGISNGLNGATLLGVNPSITFAAAEETVDGVKLVDGRQQIEMRISERGAYEPNVLTVQKDVPVDWTVFGGDFLGCADTLMMPTFDVQTNIETGKNLVQFTPDKTGKFTFSCSMGMIRGTMIVVDDQT